MRLPLLCAAAALLSSGCALFPEIAHQPTFHNPFPQLSRVAVLPFYNQSAEPTLSGERVAIAYATELQQIPGFEVVPVGVARQLMLASGIQPHSGADFQRLAQLMDVDAVVVGSITEYSPYYPPRMGLAIEWYAANPGFHPIPPGYGLPWGTGDEEYIPAELVQEAEFALAREQLKTQSPPAFDDPPPGATVHGPLPPGWPDPAGFVPDGPSPVRPPLRPQSEPVLRQVRMYDGSSGRLAESLESYHWFREDRRAGGWESYLKRSDDFIRFCCYLHLTEMLAARGGAGETRVVWRWSADR